VDHLLVVVSYLLLAGRPRHRPQITELWGHRGHLEDRRHGTWHRVAALQRVKGQRRGLGRLRRLGLLLPLQGAALLVGLLLVRRHGYLFLFNTDCIHVNRLPVNRLRKRGPANLRRANLQQRETGLTECLQKLLVSAAEPLGAALHPGPWALVGPQSVMHLPFGLDAIRAHPAKGYQEGLLAIGLTELAHSKVRPGGTAHLPEVGPRLERGNVEELGTPLGPAVLAVVGVPVGPVLERAAMEAGIPPALRDLYSRVPLASHFTDYNGRRHLPTGLPRLAVTASIATDFAIVLHLVYPPLLSCDLLSLRLIYLIPNHLRPHVVAIRARHSVHPNTPTLLLNVSPLAGDALHVILIQHLLVLLVAVIVSASGLHCPFLPLLRSEVIL